MHWSLYAISGIPAPARMMEILVIDDTEEVRRFFRVVLEQAGYAVREASSGSEGIRLFRESPSDIVITDMYMPNGDGFDVLRTLRGEEPFSGRLNRHRPKRLTILL